MHATTASTTDTEHVTAHVAAPALPAQITQRKFETRYPPGHWLPYIHQAFHTLPQRILDLIDAGHPRSAEYWLLSAEHFAGVLGGEAFTRHAAAVGSFELCDSPDVEPWGRRAAHSSTGGLP